MNRVTRVFVRIAGRHSAKRERCEAYNQLPADRWNDLDPVQVVVDLREPVLV